MHLARVISPSTSTHITSSQYIPNSFQSKLDIKILVIAMSSTNSPPAEIRAQTLRSLLVPGSPLLLINVWDPSSASIVLSHPGTKALATASFAIAASLGLEDDELNLVDNLAAINRIVQRMKKEGREDVPLTADLQDGYGDDLVSAIEGAVKLGVVGANIEDARLVDGRTVLADVEEQVSRIKLALATAASAGVPGFVVNARTDCVMLGGTVEEAVLRGKRYLEAGASTVFVWGGKRGLRNAEVRTLAKELNGMVNVSYRRSVEGALSVKQIAELGVARVSIGPGLWRESVAAVEKEVGRILGEYHG